ncbi:MAG TPA: (2Fe-2S)-binding protein [Sedimentisphaerales bacterium]
MFATPPVPMPARGKIVCNCFNVSANAIQVALADLQSSGVTSPDVLLNALQTQTKCGTNCGSCVPEIKQMIRASLAESTPE